MAENFVSPIIGILGPKNQEDNSFYLYDSLERNNKYVSFASKLAYLRGDAKVKNLSIPSLGLIEDFQMLEEGDVLALHENGLIEVLLKRNDLELTLFITNNCNSKCIMCPQIEKGNDEAFLHNANLKLLKLSKGKKLANIAMTGGEPTLFAQNVLELLIWAKKFQPETPILLLTNGRFFSDIDKALPLIEHFRNDSWFCIPIHSDVDFQHDLIANANGAFVETMRGILNLFRLKQSIEIRIVISKLNYNRLRQISEFIYYNLPFAVHVAFMGLEVVGRATANIDDVWIDPLEFKDQLNEAVFYLNKRGMLTSIYNIPFCLTNKETWSFCRNSISLWKKTFHNNCSSCLKQTDCCGIFGTSEKTSDFIKPITI